MIAQKSLILSVLTLMIASSAFAKSTCKWASYNESKFDDCLALASAGDAAAQYAVGRAYLLGSGIEKNDIEGDEWIEKSALQNYVEAQYFLGLQMESRFHNELEPSLEKAVHWFTKAAEAGNADAQYSLALIFISNKSVAQNVDDAIKWFKKSADNKNAEAALYLYDLYSKGTDVTKDDAEALRWLMKAAELGSRDAQTQLGVNLLYGLDGAVKNEAEALKWLLKAGQQGVAEAQVLAAYLLAQTAGKDGKKKLKESVDWFAAAVKEDRAQEICVLFFSPSEYLKPNAPGQSERVVAWCEQEAKKGNTKAQFAMAAMYKSGYVSTSSSGEQIKGDAIAFQWGMTAKLLGDELASEAVRKWLAEGLDPEARKKAEAAAKQWIKDNKKS